MRKIDRAFVKILHETLRPLVYRDKYPWSIQVAALVLLAGLLGIAYAVKSRLMPLAFFALDTASRI